MAMDQDNITKDYRVVEVEVMKDELGFPQPPLWLTNLTKTKLWSVIPDKQVDIKDTQPDFAGLVDKLLGKAKHDISIAQNRKDKPSTSRHEPFDFTKAVNDMYKSEQNYACQNAITEQNVSDHDRVVESYQAKKFNTPIELESNTFVADVFGATECEYFDDEEEEDDGSYGNHLAKNTNNPSQHSDVIHHYEESNWKNERIGGKSSQKRHPLNRFEAATHCDDDFTEDSWFDDQYAGIEQTNVDTEYLPVNHNTNLPGRRAPLLGENYQGNGSGLTPRFFRGLGPRPGLRPRGQGLPGCGPRLPGCGPRHIRPGFDDLREDFRNNFHDGREYRRDQLYGDVQEYHGNRGFGGFGEEEYPREGGFAFRQDPGFQGDNTGPWFSNDQFGPRFPNAGPRFGPRFGTCAPRPGSRATGWNGAPRPQGPRVVPPRQPTVLGGPAGFPLVTPKFIIPGPDKQPEHSIQSPAKAAKKQKKNRWAKETHQNEIKPEESKSSNPVLVTERPELIPPAEELSLQFNKPEHEPEANPQPPEPVVIDYSHHPGQDRLDKWFHLKAMDLQPVVDARPKPVPLSVKDARSLLLDGYKYLEKLQRLQDLDPDGSEALEVKETLTKLVSLLSEDAVNNLAKRLKDRRKKRTNRRDRTGREKQTTLERRECLHARIDAERQAEQDRLLNIETEHQMRKNADKILSEVKKKLATNAKALNVLTNLKKLREIRKKDAEKKGFLVPDECNSKFEARLRETMEMLARQHKLYASEEQTLQVMLETENALTRKKARDAFRDRENKRRLRQRKRLLQSLFGEEYTGTDEDPVYPFYTYYTLAEHDLATFLRVRGEWDVYLVPDGTPYGSCVPVGWVQPVPPATDTWATVLDT